MKLSRYFLFISKQFRLFFVVSWCFFALISASFTLPSGGINIPKAYITQKGMLYIAYSQDMFTVSPLEPSVLVSLQPVKNVILSGQLLNEDQFVGHLHVTFFNLNNKFQTSVAAGLLNITTESHLSEIKDGLNSSETNYSNYLVLSSRINNWFSFHIGEGARLLDSGHSSALSSVFFGLECNLSYGSFLMEYDTFGLNIGYKLRFLDNSSLNLAVTNINHLGDNNSDFQVVSLGFSKEFFVKKKVTQNPLTSSDTLLVPFLKMKDIESQKAILEIISYYDLAFEAYQVNDTALSKMYLKKILDLDENQYEALNRLGLLYFDDNNIDEASMYWSQHDRLYFTRSSHEVDSFLSEDKTTEILNDVDLFLNSQDVQGAIIFLTEIIDSMDEKSPELYFTLGKLWMTLGDEAKAFSIFSQVIQLNYNYEPLWNYFNSNMN